MLYEPDGSLLEAVLDSWDRNNTIMLNLLHALPEGSLGVRATKGGPTVAETLMHTVYIRLVHIFEDAPEFSKPIPEHEWADLRERQKMHGAAAR